MGIGKGRIRFFLGKGAIFMNKAVLYYGFILLFVVLFVFGFFITPWLSFASFFPLAVGAILLFRNRYIKK